jgi:hypothetical protein
MASYHPSAEFKSAPVWGIEFEYVAMSKRHLARILYETSLFARPGFTAIYQPRHGNLYMGRRAASP